MLLKNDYDVVIIGGGIAGISCALELTDSKVDYILIDLREKLGGQLNEIDNTIVNFAGCLFQDGTELQKDIEELCATLCVNTLLGQTVRKVNLLEKVLSLEAGELSAKALFLATGYRIRQLDLPEVEEFRGSIVYKCETNTERLTGLPVAVVGGGDNALMDALWLAEICPSVLLVHRSEKWKARADVIDDVKANKRIHIRANSVVTSLEGQDGELQSLCLLDNRSLAKTRHEARMLVVKIGYAPNTEIFSGQLELDSGHIPVGPCGETSIEGVFAGGDITAPPYPRLARAAGQGVTAAGAIRRYLRA